MKDYLDYNISVDAMTQLNSQGLKLNVNIGVVPCAPHPEYEQITLTDEQLAEVSIMSQENGDAYLADIIRQRLALKYGAGELDGDNFLYMPYYENGCFYSCLSTSANYDNSYSSIRGVIALRKQYLAQKFKVEGVDSINQKISDDIRLEIDSQLDYISATINDEHVELVVTAFGDTTVQHQSKATVTIDDKHHEHINTLLAQLVRSTVKKIDNEGTVVKLSFDESLLDDEAEAKEEVLERIKGHIVDEIDCLFGFKFPIGSSAIDIERNEISLNILISAAPSDDSLIVNTPVNDIMGLMRAKREAADGSTKEYRKGNLAIMFDNLYGINFIELASTNNLSK